MVKLNAEQRVKDTSKELNWPFHDGTSINNHKDEEKSLILLNFFKLENCELLFDRRSPFDT